MARAYLEALARGDAKAALDLGPRVPDSPTLSDTALRRQRELAPITDIGVERTVAFSDETWVYVDYTLGDDRISSRVLHVSKVGSGWQLASTVVRVRVSGKVPGLTMLGVPVGEATEVLAFPGPHGFASTSPVYTAVEQDVDGYARYPETTPRQARLTVGLTDAAERDGVAAGVAALRACELSTEAQPAGCPQHAVASAGVTWHIVRGLDDLVARTGLDGTPELFGSITWTATVPGEQPITSSTPVHVPVSFETIPPTVHFGRGTRPCPVDQRDGAS
jgi:hypothetical protein